MRIVEPVNRMSQTPLIQLDVNFVFLGNTVKFVHIK